MSRSTGKDPSPAVAGEPLVRVRGLTFARGERTIFSGIDLDVRRGSITAVMGPSGCGKSTLLKLIGGQLAPAAGFVEVEGVRVHDLNRTNLFDLRRRMGVLFQSPALLTDMSVFDNVALPLREHTSLPQAMIRTLVLAKLQAVGLRGARELMPEQLSGGMARRVALARTIVFDPMLIMYDEPFAGQDPISMGVLLELIEALNKAIGTTSLIVSHDIAETCRIADYVYLLANGEVVAQGTPDKLLATESGLVEQFMKGRADGPVQFHYPAPALLPDLLEPGS